MTFCDTNGHGRRYRILHRRIDGLKLVTEPPPALRPREVLVRMRATSINYRDLLVIEGPWPARDPTGLIPLSDGAGEVVEVGSEVTRFHPGDPVVASFRQQWLGGEVGRNARDSDLGGMIDGTLSEWCVFDEQGLTAKPSALSFEEAACFPCAAVTAWSALMEGAPLTPGDTVLIQGTGGVSLFALQFARAAGAQVIAITSTVEKMALLREMGAATVVNYVDQPDWNDAVLDATEGRGVKRVVEVGGAGTLGRSLACVAPWGEIALVGLLADHALVDPRPIMSKSVVVRGITVGSRTHLEAALQCFAQGGMRPVIARSFAFEEALTALSFFKDRLAIGKVVVKICGQRS